MSLLLLSVRGSYSAEAIFDSGPKFPKVLHLGISASFEGKELCLLLFFADGCLWSDPCWVKADKDRRLGG